MNRELAAAFGTLPPNPEMVKEAMCRDAFSKLAAEDGVDLSRMTDAAVANEYTAFRQTIKMAEIQEAKEAEAARMGRAMARVVPMALFVKGAGVPSPYHSDFMSALQGVPGGAKPDALRAALTPESIIARAGSGLITPQDAGDMARAAGYHEGVVQKVMTDAGKAWEGGGALQSPGAWKTYQEGLKGRTAPMALDELLAHGGGAAKSEGLLSKLSPMGLGEAVSKGQWGRAAGKVAPIGAALLAGKWLLNRKRENQAAMQGPSLMPQVAMAGV